MAAAKRSSVSGNHQATSSVVYPIVRVSLYRTYEKLMTSSGVVDVFVREDGMVMTHKEGYRQHTVVGRFTRGITYSELAEQVFYAAETEPKFRMGRLLRMIVQGTNTVTTLANTLNYSRSAIQSRIFAMRDMGWIKSKRKGLSMEWEVALDETYLAAPDANR